MEQGINRFNVRVYFLLQHPTEPAILLSDERIKGYNVVKFPGGGLEFGEGPEECARREAIEELGQEISIVSHLYTTGFFQRSKFQHSDQIISIYYRAELYSYPLFQTCLEPFDFALQTGDSGQALRWVRLEDFSENLLTLPIDKVAARVFLSSLKP
jgi:8-oxo-dGTP pyrophosphatase MutT (NUDIX family)